jgi:hypothetical protein
MGSSASPQLASQSVQPRKTVRRSPVMRSPPRRVRTLDAIDTSVAKQRILVETTPPPSLVTDDFPSGCRKNERSAPSNTQLIEQRLRLLQIARVGPFGEPAVDRSE